MKLILIRHGETDWNRERRWQGQADIPLNAHGIEQAARMAQDLVSRVHLDAIYSSDLSRARHTAEALASAALVSSSAAPELRLDPRLREVNQGEWEGMVIDDIRAQYAEAFAQRTADPWNLAPPGGETAAQVCARVSAVITEIAAKYANGANAHSTDAEGTVAVVAHGFVLAVARIWLTGEPVERIWDLIPDNCDPLLIEWTRAIE